MKCDHCGVKRFVCYR